MSKASTAADKTGHSSDYTRSVKTLNRMLREMRTGQWVEASNEPVPVKIMGRGAATATPRKVS